MKQPACGVGILAICVFHAGKFGWTDSLNADEVTTERVDGFVELEAFSKDSVEIGIDCRFGINRQVLNIRRVTSRLIHNPDYQQSLPS